MKKFISFILTVILAACCAVCPSVGAEDAAPGPWLPDPCTALRAEGQYVQTTTESNGVTYALYAYDFRADYETVAHFIVVYTEALRAMGFTAKKLNRTAGSVWYEQYNRTDCAGAELAVFVSADLDIITGGGEGGWRVVLAVPACYTFIPGNGAPGIVNGNTPCFGCSGSGKCAGCGGTGRADYGDGYETCVLCDGNGLCTVCDGEGSY